MTDAKIKELIASYRKHGALKVYAHEAIPFLEELLRLRAAHEKLEKAAGPDITVSEIGATDP